MFLSYVIYVWHITQTLQHHSSSASEPIDNYSIRFSSLVST
nr:MAG TPA: hypothetical protein [Caudoviricetes sp.]